MSVVILENYIQCFFFQAEDGIRDHCVTGVQTCALPISARDCDTNSIDYKPLNGGCGAASPAELIKDIKSNNPNDLKNIYAHFGLDASSYEKLDRKSVV